MLAALFIVRLIFQMEHSSALCGDSHVLHKDEWFKEFHHSARYVLDAQTILKLFLYKNVRLLHCFDQNAV